MDTLKILSGGAAQGLIASLMPAFEASTGSTITGEFGAVGTMAAKLRAGDAVDVIVLTAALIDELKIENRLVADSIRPVGVVETCLAVRAGDAVDPVNNIVSLRATFLAADAIFVPDMTTSTAGIHVAKALQRLGIAEQVSPRLKIFPNGATAMKNLAASGVARPLGCTQATEIIATPGVKLAGSLPDPLALRTTYAAAVTAKAANGAVARRFVDLLAGPDQRSPRARSGFLEP